MQQYLSSQKRLTAVRLPPYSPDLNPGEFAWGNIQTKELANLCSNNLGAMVSGVRKGFARVHKNKSLPHPSTNMQVYPSIIKSINHAGLNNIPTIERISIIFPENIISMHLFKGIQSPCPFEILSVILPESE
jgi:hypothetical protein